MKKALSLLLYFLLTTTAFFIAHIFYNAASENSWYRYEQIDFISTVPTTEGLFLSLNKDGKLGYQETITSHLFIYHFTNGTKKTLERDKWQKL